MRFTPKSEQQIQEERFPVLPPGKYHFEVIDAKDEVSKKGNPMIVLQLKILDSSLSPVAYLKDYLMESIAYKLRHAAYVAGLGDRYESGDLEADAFKSKAGLVNIGIQKDKTGQYPDKNSILDYIQEEQDHSGEWNNMPEPPDWIKNN